MRVFTPEAIAAREAGTSIEHGAIKIACDPAVRVWGGFGEITLDGEVYKGIGDRGLVKATGGALGAQAQNTSLSLSGVDPETLALLDATTIRRVDVLIWRLTFDGSRTVLLDARVWGRGKLDVLSSEETIGGEAIISAEVEGAARSQGRAGGRMRTDADQRLISVGDGGFQAVSYAGEKTLAWGGLPPARGSTALPGAGNGWSGNVGIP